MSMKPIPLIWKLESGCSETIVARNALIYLCIRKHYYNDKHVGWALDWNGSECETFPTRDDARNYADAEWLKRFAECVADSTPTVAGRVV